MKKLVVLFLFAATPAFAGNQFQIKRLETTPTKRPMNAQFEVKSVQIQEVVPTIPEIYGFEPTDSTAEAPAPASDLGGLGEILGGIDLDKIVMIGKKVIELVKNGAPVVNVTRDAVYAVPSGLKSWQELAGWKAPLTKVYQIKVLNGFNMAMVDARVKVSAMYGGSYNNKGQYLANVIVVPTSINVKWGITFDLWSEHREPVNMGTMDSPVAGLGFDIRYKIKSWLTEINGTQDYFVSGAGELIQLK